MRREQFPCPVNKESDDNEGYETPEITDTPQEWKHPAPPVIFYYWNNEKDGECREPREMLKKDSVNESK